MRLTCRSCGATGSAETVFGDADAAEALTLAGELEPATARIIWHYLALFRPKQRALTWPRTANLLREIVELMREPTIRRRHRDWAVTPAMWRAAIETITGSREKLVLPLKGHGYLLEILAALADKTEGAAERQHEAGVRQRLSEPSERPQAAGSAIDWAMQDLHSERQSRKRLGLPPMTADDESAFLAAKRGGQT